MPAVPSPSSSPRERGEETPAVETVIDRVVAPLMYRVLFRPAGLDAACARRLARGVLGPTGR